MQENEHWEIVAYWAREKLEEFKNNNQKHLTATQTQRIGEIQKLLLESTTNKSSEQKRHKGPIRKVCIKLIKLVKYSKNDSG